MATITQGCCRARRDARLTNAQRRNITGYIFIMPFILGVLFWLVIPGGVAAWLSFQEWNLIPRPIRRAGKLPQAVRRQAVLAGAESHHQSTR